MARPYSMGLGKRVVSAVERDGLSRNAAAARYGVAISTAVKMGGACSQDRQRIAGADRRAPGEHPDRASRLAD